MTNEGKGNLVRVKYIVMDLQRTRISCNSGREGIEVLHAGGKKFFRVRSIRNGVELPHQELPWIIHRTQHKVFPYPWKKSQPHRPACHAQRSQKLRPLITVIADPPAIRGTEPCVGTGEPRVRGDVREDGNDKFIWEFENYKSEMERVNFRPKEVMGESY